MDTAEDILSVTDLSLDQSDMVLAVQAVDKAVGTEITVFGGKIDFGHLLNQVIMALAIVLELLDAHKSDAPFLCQLFELRSTHHGTVLAHDLAAKTACMKSCQAAQIHCGLSVAVPLQDTVWLCQKREHMAGSAEILRFRAFLYNSHCCHGTLFRGDACGRGDMIDGDRKRCLMVVCVGADHLRDLQTSDIFLGHGHADQAFAVRRHKIDILCGRKLCRTDKIAFVFAVGIIHNENDLAVPEILQCLFY